jgi:phosphoribosylanthranilate isomerase
MSPAQKPRVKICCILTIEEARLAISYGASAVGFVSEMPSGPGVISEDEIAFIVRKIPPGISSFLLTSKVDAASIIAQHRRCRTNTIQLVDAVPFSVYDDLRKELPGIALVQVIHVRELSSVQEAKSVEPYVNALLLDSGNPSLAVKELGGTGRTHDWDISRRIRETVDLPVFLAGGLHAGNVQTAIAQVKPFGLDLCSGVRTAGRLDEVKLSAFFNAVQSATT